MSSCDRCGRRARGRLCKLCRRDLRREELADNQPGEELWDCSECGGVHSDYYTECPRT